MQKLVVGYTFSMNENISREEAMKDARDELNKIPAQAVQIKIPDFNKKPEEEKPQIVEDKKIPEAPKDYILRGIVFFVLALLLLGAVFFVYNYSDQFLKTGKVTTEQKLVFENELVRADKSRVISLEAGATKEAVRNVIIQALLNEKVSTGEVSLIMPSYLRDTIVDGERKLISELQRGDDFFFTFAVRSPLNLRTLSAERYAIGTAGVGNVEESGSKNFFVFSVSSAPDATREMLRYEAEIYKDMKDILKLREIKGDFYFKDLSDNNHLLRVGYDDNGVVLVYGFGAPRTIIVAPDTATFQTVYLHLK